MTKLTIAFILLAIVLEALFAQTAASQDIKTCGDFGSQAEAQAHYDAGGGRPQDWYGGMDQDGDGVVCENYNYQSWIGKRLTWVQAKASLVANELWIALAIAPFIWLANLTANASGKRLSSSARVQSLRDLARRRSTADPDKPVSQSSADSGVRSDDASRGT